MPITLRNPRIERLREMLNLEERRARLQTELDGLSTRISTLKDELSGSTTLSKATTAPFSQSNSAAGRSPGARKGGITPRGALKEKIMAALESAGNAGVRVKDLAAALGTKAVNVHSWFHSTIKRNPAIKKLSGGHYRLEGGAGASPASTPGGTASSSSSRPKTGRKLGPQPRGALSARIHAELQRAGENGITVKNLASKLGANHKNIYIWFATTGKKNRNIKKVAPATYRLTT